MPRLPALVSALLATLYIAHGQVTFPSLNSSPWLGQEMLGRVGSNSVAVNIVFDQDMQVYFEYGTVAGIYGSKSATQSAIKGVPLEVVLSGLAPNTRYYYRVQFAVAGSTSFSARPERTFVTQRPRGAPFTFVVQADPHLDNNSSTDVYKLTLANELADKPDFLVDLGDVMLADKLDATGVPVNGGSSPTAAGILTRTQLHRSFYDLATHSVPLFLAVGNHEAEWGSNLNGTANDVAVWDTQYRTQYFPNPVPDSFFSGDSQTYDSNGNACTAGQGANCGLGLRRSYYAWEWGDALFIVLDPFWSQTPDASTTQAGNGASCCQKGAGYWSLTLGTAQYAWLKRTLEKGTAPYKFVFSHNLVGGLDRTVNGVSQGPLRGGVEAAPFLEWGGNNLDGTWGFSTYRPDMPMPIHQLLVANGVTAYFHGHDHLYAHQVLDGITYQEVPQPSAANANLGTRASDYGYTQGTLLGGRGYLRVQVAASSATVQYVETWLPAEQKGTIANGMVADVYSVLPHLATTAAPAVSSVLTAEDESPVIAPNTWMEIKGSNLAASSSSRIWQAADFVNNQMPTQLDGVSVTVNGKPAYVYYVSQTQLNILTPPDALTGSVAVQVVVNGAAGTPFPVQAQTAAPSLFVFNGGPYAAARHGADSSLLGPASLYPGSSTPAAPNEIILLYGNGFGATSSPVDAGSVVQSGTLSPLPQVTIGGISAVVQFAGLVAPGQFQFNVVVPPNVSNGDQKIVVTYNGLSTQSNVLLPVQAQAASSSFTLTSTAGTNGGQLPADYTCDGTGSTIQLSWANAPVGTVEFAVLMTTLPGDGTTKWNWVLYHIPATATNLAKNSFLVGTLGVGSDGPGTVYNPPCSQGPGAKLYTWTVYALSGSPAFAVPANQVTGDLVTAAISSLKLGSATLNLSYSRTTSSTGSSAACGYLSNSVRASKSGTASVSCDGTYAYVGSLGITTAPMMNGITSTNLQIPTPQNFQGSNGWKIPLNPALASAPTSVLDGPIGVAINGVPIFNPCTQGGCVTGGDTKALGQLDTCNGHAGRADDYHYHAAPTCMMADQPANYWDTHPVGWALDGFAIFGYRDADGTTAARDSVCGGNTKSVPNAPAGYSYHVTDAPPYVTNCLAGTPSPDLPNQASKYHPFRQPPVTPFNDSGMTLTTDATDGYQVLQFTSGIPFKTTETGTDSYSNAPGTYKIRYKQVTGGNLAALLALRQNANATACWNFQFLNSGSAETQPSVSYCK